MRETAERLKFELVNGGTLKEGLGTGEATAKTVGILYGIDLILEFEMSFEEEEKRSE